MSTFCFAGFVPVGVNHETMLPQKQSALCRDGFWKEPGSQRRLIATTATTRRSSLREAEQREQRQFRKYEGLGNDFVLVDNRNQSELVVDPDRVAALCDRHTGIGADGFIFLLAPQQKGGSGSEEADFAMRVINSDGSEPEMCGNGVRCLARFIEDLGIATSDTLRIDTKAGEIRIALRGDVVQVDMGEPILDPVRVPTLLTPQPPAVSASLEVDGRSWDVVPVSMGNPHAVVFVDPESLKFIDDNLERIGPLFELHPAFPARTNTEFVTVRSASTLEMIVWERGAGRTRACGTGACAVGVAANLLGLVSGPCTVLLPGGPLDIDWNRSSNHVYMTGPAKYVFQGSLDC